MNFRIEIISGLNQKAPAAILLSTPSQRILLDAGGALDTESDDWAVPDNLDAVLLSHDHIDHIAGLCRLPPHVPVYCSAVTARSLPAHRSVQVIAVRGQFRLGELTVTTGSCGHAYGGVWFHFDVPGGLFYSGDISMESALFRFDPPPRAEIALVDASYGLYDTPQSQQRAHIAAYLRQPTLCPVPPSGRAVEIALLEAQAGRLAMALDDDCRAMLTAMAEYDDGSLQTGVQAGLRALRQQLPPFSVTAPLILAADPDGQTGMAGALRAQPDFYHRTLFTGHMNPRARQQWQSGEVDFCRWNVHPTRRCLQRLVMMLGCHALAPLFTPLDDVPRWQQALGCTIITDSTIEREVCH